jgi:hypothetical protein
MQRDFSYCKSGGTYDTVNVHQHQVHFQINLDSGVSKPINQKYNPLAEIPSQIS